MISHVSPNDAENARQEKLAKYDSSRLGDWLRLPTWTPEEALCLLCDIDPTGAIIHWDGFTNAHGGHVDAPMVERGQLLTERPDSSYAQPGDRVFEITSSGEYDPWFIADDLMIVPIKGSLGLRRHHAELRLRWAWKKYMRNAKHGNLGNRPPYEFINWAESDGIPIHWIGWAFEYGFLDENSSDAISGADVMKPLDQRQRNSYLVIIAALCQQLGIDPERRGIAKKIAGFTQDLGCALSDQTIRDTLKDLPDAVSLRMKS